MSAPDTTTPPTGSPSAELALMQSPAARAVRKLPVILVKRIVVLAVIFATAAAAGVTLAVLKGATSYTLQSQMVFTPLPSAPELRNVYDPPDLKTLITFVKTPGTLSRLIDEFDLAVDPRLLDKMIELENPSQTQTINLKFEWDDNEQGKAILDRMMTLYVQEVATMRREKLRGYVSNMNQAVMQSKRRLDAAYNTVASFNARLGVDDYKTADDKVMAALEYYENEIAKMKVEALALERQIADTKDRKVNSERRAAEEAEKEAAEAAQQESVIEQRARQERMTQKLREERAKLEIKAQIDAKTAELRRVRALYEKRYASQADVQAKQTELTTLYAKIAETPLIKELQTEIERLDQSVVPDAKKPKANPIITQLNSAELAQEQDLLATQIKIEQYRTQVAFKRDLLERLNNKRNEAKALEAEIVNLSTALASNTAQLAAFEKLLSYDAQEFSIASPASSDLQVPSSNKKKLVIVGFLPVIFLFAGPLIMWDLWKARQPDGAMILLQHGLNELSPPVPSIGVFGPKPFDLPQRRRWSDQVALRFQQMAPHVGSKVLVSHHKLAPMDGVLLADVAACLASRDENVLVILATPDQDEHATMVHALMRPEQGPRAENDPHTANRFTGISEFLSHECDDTVELIQHTPVQGVDLVTAGMRPMTRNTLATRRMDELIEQVGQGYSTVLIVGPDFADSVSVEVLARLADGIVVCFEQEAPFSIEEEYCIDSLMELGAPIWGVAIRPLQPPEKARKKALKKARKKGLLKRRQGDGETGDANQVDPPAPTDADLKALGAHRPDQQAELTDQELNELGVDTTESVADSDPERHDTN